MELDFVNLYMKMMMFYFELHVWLTYTAFIFFSFYDSLIDFPFFAFFMGLICWYAQTTILDISSVNTYKYYLR